MKTETIEKLYILSFEKPNDIIMGIVKTYLKHGIITNFDVLYVNKKYTELGLKKWYLK